MTTHSTDQSTAETVPIPLLTKVDKAQKNIAKLEARQLKLNTAKERAVKDLVDAKRAEAIETGQTEFVKAIEELDLSTREVVVTTVLEPLKDVSRRARIQAWVAMIPKPGPRPNSTGQRNQTEVGSGLEPPPAANQPEPAANQPEPAPAKPENSVADPAPTE